MPYTLSIPDALFKRLQQHAVPLIDTPISVIERWADYFDSNAITESRSDLASISRAEKAFDPSNPPNLLHTTCKGHFGKEHFGEWNELLRIAHVQAHKKLKAFDEIRRITMARIRQGNHSEKGYHFIPETGFSLQGVDANRAWSYSLKIAKALRTSVIVSFEWRNNDKAASPGNAGVLEWNPVATSV